MSSRVLQLTNPSIGSVAVNSFIPFGNRTVLYPSCDIGDCNTFSITSSMSDTVQLNKSGAYKVIYNASLVATDAGDVVLNLKVNGVTVYSVTELATAGAAVNLTIPFEVYAACNCASNPNNLPMFLQVQSTGVAITSGTSNLIVTKE